MSSVFNQLSIYLSQIQYREFLRFFLNNAIKYKIELRSVYFIVIKCICISIVLYILNHFVKVDNVRKFKINTNSADIGRALTCCTCDTVRDST